MITNKLTKIVMLYIISCVAVSIGIVIGFAFGAFISWSVTMPVMTWGVARAVLAAGAAATLITVLLDEEYN
jgi:hypothetical protein